MPDLSLSTLLVLVPLLPLVGAILTVALGRVLGPRAHLPAVAGIAGSAAVAITLLMGMAREVGVGESGHEHAVRPVEMVTTLWECATVP
ncbi:MAG: hypothetical protein WCO99_02135, partial [Planctomycetota bacterium]